MTPYHSTLFICFAMVDKRNKGSDASASNRVPAGINSHEKPLRSMKNDLSNKCPENLVCWGNIFSIVRMLSHNQPNSPSFNSSLYAQKNIFSVNSNHKCWTFNNNENITLIYL